MSWLQPGCNLPTPLVLCLRCLRCTARSFCLGRCCVVLLPYEPVCLKHGIVRRIHTSPIVPPLGMIHSKINGANTAAGAPAMR